MPGSTMTAPSAEVLLVQLQNLKRRHDRVVAEHSALKATNGEGPALLVSVAEALAAAGEAALAPPVSVSLESEGRRQRPGSKTPPHDPAARAALKGLESALNRAVSTYWSRRDNDWHRPEEQVGKVRCRNTKCSRLDRRTLKEVQVGGSTIQFSHCPECGSRLTDV